MNLLLAVLLVFPAQLYALGIPAAPSAPLLYEDAAMALGATGYWRGNDLSGTAAREHALGRDGTYINTPTLGVAGLLEGNGDTAVRYARGSVEHVHTIDNADFDGTNPSTWTCWVRANNANANNETLMSKMSNFGSGPYVIKNVTTGAISWVDGAVALMATTDTGDGNPHFVCAVKASGRELFIDGVSENTDARPNPPTNSDVFAIAIRGSADEFPADSDIGHVALFPLALSSGQAAMLNLIGIGEQVFPGDYFSP